MTTVKQCAIAISLLSFACTIEVVRSFFVNPNISRGHTNVRMGLKFEKATNNPILSWNNPSHCLLFQSATGDMSQKIITSEEGSDAKSIVEEELERLQQTMTFIEALEERNKAQLESFVDKEDQWESLEEFEKDLLNSKDDVLNRMEKMTEELLQLWMGAKSMEG